MLVLAIETATDQASIVLAEDDAEVAAWREVTHQDLCRRIAAETSSLLASAGVRPQNLDLIAVGLGPGAFTSTRIALATATGFALGADTPLVGISSFAAMAWQMRDKLPGLLCPVLDAKRGELYAALYRPAAEEVTREGEEFVASAQQLTQRLSSLGETVTLFGQPEVLPADLSDQPDSPIRVWREQNVLPDARGIAHLGRRQYLARGADPIGSLRPIYVRMSYAEEAADLDLGLR